MPFDPTQPAANSALRSAPIRANFQALFDLIQQFSSVAGAQIDSITSVEPNEPPSASATIIDQVLHLSFAIPRGQTGPQGPAFASAQVDTVTTLNPGETAQASVAFDGSALRFSFGIPRGFDGSPGADGQTGAPGEVSLVDLNNALSGTSANSNGVAPLDQSADPNYNSGQIQDLINKMNELIGVLRR